MKRPRKGTKERLEREQWVTIKKLGISQNCTKDNLEKSQWFMKKRIERPQEGTKGRLERPD